MLPLSECRFLPAASLPPSRCPCWDLQSLNPPASLSPLASPWLYGSPSPTSTPESNIPECPPQHFQPSSPTSCDTRQARSQGHLAPADHSQLPGHPARLEGNTGGTERSHYEFKVGTWTCSLLPHRNSPFPFLWAPRGHLLSSFFRSLSSGPRFHRGHTHSQQTTCSEQTEAP